MESDDSPAKRAIGKAGGLPSRSLVSLIGRALAGLIAVGRPRAGLRSSADVTSVDRFDPLDPEVIADPYPWYRWLLREAPVYHDEANALWVLSRYDDVLAATRAPGALSSEQGVAYRAPGLPMMISMDPPGHTRLRSIVSREFTPKSLAFLLPTHPFNTNHSPLLPFPLIQILLPQPPLLPASRRLHRGLQDRGAGATRSPRGAAPRSGAGARRGERGPALRRARAGLLPQRARAMR